MNEPLVWTIDSPTIPGDYLCNYRFPSVEDSEWQERRIEITQDDIPVEPDTSITYWYGPIPKFNQP